MNTRGPTDIVAWADIVPHIGKNRFGGENLKEDDPCPRCGRIIGDLHRCDFIVED